MIMNPTASADQTTPAAQERHTPGPWKWQGEDYRGGWGWQMLVGPSGEGLIIGQDVAGGICKELRAFEPMDPALCVTGMKAIGKPRVESVHVFSEANARLIVAAPDLLEALSDIVHGCDDPHPDQDVSLALMLVALLPAARAAVAKAKGTDQ